MKNGKSGDVYSLMKWQALYGQRARDALAQNKLELAKRCQRRQQVMLRRLERRRA